VIVDVTKDQKGQQIRASRSSEELLKRLFEMEVPEIYDETVVIKSAVREPGDRAKIAVASNEKDVDPVGACVGMKGSRVQSIIKELRGEKIDIIEWSDEPSVFAANALSPAKVSQVRITDINNRQMEVIVGEDQLSLAIGKKGQNVRLATRLVGWDIKIVSEDVLKKEIARQMGRMMASGEAVPIGALQGVSAVQAEALEEKGIKDVETLATTSVDDLVDILDVSLDEAEAILTSANSIVEARNEEVAGPEESAEIGAGEQAEPLEPETNIEAASEIAGDVSAEPVTPPEAESSEVEEAAVSEPEMAVAAGTGDEEEAQPITEAADEAAAASHDAETPAEKDI
jgi:transcription termination/antitermination protein NusA